MQFKKTAREWKAHNMETLSLPFEFVQKQMVCSSFDLKLQFGYIGFFQISGTAFPSFGTMVLEEDMSENEQNIHKWTLGNLYGGGADTVGNRPHFNNQLHFIFSTDCFCSVWIHSCYGSLSLSFATCTAGDRCCHWSRSLTWLR